MRTWVSGTPWLQSGAAMHTGSLHCLLHEAHTDSPILGTAVTQGCPLVRGSTVSQMLLRLAQSSLALVSLLISSLLFSWRMRFPRVNRNPGGELGLALVNPNPGGKLKLALESSFSCCSGFLSGWGAAEGWAYIFS